MCDVPGVVTPPERGKSLVPAEALEVGMALRTGTSGVATRSLEHLRGESEALLAREVGLVDVEFRAAYERLRVQTHEPRVDRVRFDVGRE
jgi:hypothetical protein